MIKIFSTGGTIDKIYFDAKSEFQVGDPLIDEIFQDSYVSFDYEVVPIMRKDSLDMTAADRAIIRSRIEQDEATQMIITHGTDTMVETGQALLGITNKTIVLVGAMQPARLRKSDAIFNIGFAVAAVQLLPAGVYIGMNGRIFDPSTTVKNVPANQFESPN
ncbi:MAG: asparaginase domain-containing protein [Chloroflexota bacterium]